MFRRVREWAREMSRVMFFVTGPGPWAWWWKTAPGAVRVGRGPAWGCAGSCCFTWPAGSPLPMSRRRNGAGPPVISVIHTGCGGGKPPGRGSLQGSNASVRWWFLRAGPAGAEFGTPGRRRMTARTPGAHRGQKSRQKEECERLVLRTRPADRVTSCAGSCSRRVAAAITGSGHRARPVGTCDAVVRTPVPATGVPAVSHRGGRPGTAARPAARWQAVPAPSVAFDSSGGLSCLSRRTRDPPGAAPW